jgi:hypothetical protein
MSINEPLCFIKVGKYLSILVVASFLKRTLFVDCKRERFVLTDVWQAQPSKLTVPGTQTTATIQNLNPASSYHLRIMAENRLGLSDPSEVIQVTTQEEGE